MRESLFDLPQGNKLSLQSQIRELLVSAILGGQIPPQDRLPSSRQMARRLGVSRNTVVLAYQALIDDGYLVARERSGYFVNDKILGGRVSRPAAAARTDGHAPDWKARFRVLPAGQENIKKPSNWQDYPYPFIYGQVDHTLFPIAEWRECSRQALGKQWLDAWTSDFRDRDDPMLVEQIRTRLLPRRGIMATEDEGLVTLGAQNALYLLASLLVARDTVVAMEDPGYTDVRNIFRLRTDRLMPVAVDQQGLPVDERLARADLVFTTPSHQFPTTVTMPPERRSALLASAIKHDFVIVEDDYEFETNYVSEPTPALKSSDRDGRVIYIGSLSKTLFPGLRMGYLVGPAPLIEQARALRRLMVRHAPNNNQRTAALFLALGYHDALVHRLHRAYRERWMEMGRALEVHMPRSSRVPSFGGSSFWVRGPSELDADELAQVALGEGIIIEPGSIHFAARSAPRNCFRLGFSSIRAEFIEPGVKLLARLIARHMGIVG
ncbi:MAG: PLP-dependent aminotransferase family protein [Pseudomonadota bacterium]|nr:PLP-dependent aminotransferase family protein [Pseudomonadota bacterium]